MQYGPFHRAESTTQTREHAVEQCKTGEIWGRTPRGGNWPTLQAYAGLLSSRRGINFTTDIGPAPNGVLDRSSPYDVRRYLGVTPGVEKREKDGEKFACILADIQN